MCSPCYSVTKLLAPNTCQKNRYAQQHHHNNNNNNNKQNWNYSAQKEFLLQKTNKISWANWTFYNLPRTRLIKLFFWLTDLQLLLLLPQKRVVYFLTPTQNRNQPGELRETMWLPTHAPDLKTMMIINGLPILVQVVVRRNRPLKLRSVAGLVRKKTKKKKKTVTREVA